MFIETTVAQGFRGFLTVCIKPEVVGFLIYSLHYNILYDDLWHTSPQSTYLTACSFPSTPECLGTKQFNLSC